MHFDTFSYSLVLRTSVSLLRPGKAAGDMPVVNVLILPTSWLSNALKKIKDSMVEARSNAENGRGVIVLLK